jgi:hypothetical protein
LRCHDASTRRSVSGHDQAYAFRHGVSGAKGPSRFTQIKLFSVKGTRAVQRKLSNAPFREAEETKPACAKEWGTHFLVKETKSVQPVPPAILTSRRASGAGNRSTAKTFPRCEPAKWFRCPCASPEYGQMYCRKVTKSFGQSAILSAREIEHGRFRSLFGGWLWPKIQNGRTSPKNKKLSYPTGKMKGRQLHGS